MAKIPTNYPSGCTDDQIRSVIDELSKEIITSGGNINYVMRNSPVISLGQLELQKRIPDKSQLITGELHAEVKKLSESSFRNEKSSKIISTTALVISILSIAISIYFSIQSNKETQQWRQEEINLLQQILEK